MNKLERLKIQLKLARETVIRLEGQIYREEQAAYESKHNLHSGAVLLITEEFANVLMQAAPGYWTPGLFASGDWAIGNKLLFERFEDNTRVTVKLVNNSGAVGCPLKVAQRMRAAYLESR